MANGQVNGNAGSEHDKTVPWYKADIGEIPKEAQELFENYSGIAPDRVASHILAVVR